MLNRFSNGGTFLNILIDKQILFERLSLTLCNRSMDLYQKDKGNCQFDVTKVDNSFITASAASESLFLITTTDFSFQGAKLLSVSTGKQFLLIFHLNKILLLKLSRFKNLEKTPITKQTADFFNFSRLKKISRNGLTQNKDYVNQNKLTQVLFMLY